MDQPRDFIQRTDRYAGIPLGVEAAWPTAYGAPTAVPGFSSSSPSSPKRDSRVGVATSSLAVALLLGTALMAGAAPYAPAEYDFSDVGTREPALLGTVEDVREVALHAEELVVRLDDGRVIEVSLERDEHFQAGERVRLVGGRVLRT